MPSKITKYEGTTLTGQNWQLYCGDALQCLRKIPDESVDCAITSPPYFWLRDYEIDGQIGLEETVNEYVTSITRVMHEVYRVLTKRGTLFLNIGDTYYSGRGKSHGTDGKSKKRRFGLRAVDRSGGLGIGLQKKSIIGIPWRVAFQMCQDNWVLRSPIIWHRDKCLPESVRDRPRRSYEFVLFFAKNRYYYFDKRPLETQNFDEDVWTIPPQKGSNGIDTAPFPLELADRCLSIGCPPNGAVLDPFAGSGTTLVAALRAGRSAIGIDLKSEFCKYIRTRIENEA